MNLSSPGQRRLVMDWSTTDLASSQEFFARILISSGNLIRDIPALLRQPKRPTRALALAVPVLQVVIPIGQSTNCGTSFTERVFILKSLGTNLREVPASALYRRRRCHRCGDGRVLFEWITFFWVGPVAETPFGLVLITVVGRFHSARIGQAVGQISAYRDFPPWRSLIKLFMYALYWLDAFASLKITTSCGFTIHWHQRTANGPSIAHPIP